MTRLIRHIRGCPAWIALLLQDGPLGTEAAVLDMLSACDTAKGEAMTGEGVFGLRRAQAGAQTLVMSLWKVDDEVTIELMGLFYENLLSGKGRREALLLAQAEIRRKHPHPYYWAGFICQGNPGPIPLFE